MTRLPLDQEQLGVLSAELLRLRADVRAAIARRDGELAAVLADRADGTADDEHDPEGTPLSAEWSRLAGARAESGRDSAAVEAALARVAAGVYGICLRCGRPIGVDRLTARPAAELCIDCASRA